ncbi:YraN family protein [Thioalkalivibrio sp. HK1]|uniref:YraN family protein n=1 Tax=Thioalkalivibrio sp. HK1 TaxID=1469245 RepID=UPI0004707F92|nr:YraN family protein [Thioalkalivibrio sp. HK1]
MKTILAHRIGRATEDFAERWLTGKGLVPIARNYRCRRGEIDLVMRDEESLVFVEVRRRSNEFFGGGAESVDHHKQKRLTATAEHYLTSHEVGTDIACRFDILAIDGPEHEVRVEWIKDAFEF